MKIEINIELIYIKINKYEIGVEEEIKISRRRDEKRER